MLTLVIQSGVSVAAASFILDVSANRVCHQSFLIIVRMYANLMLPRHMTQFLFSLHKLKRSSVDFREKHT